MIRTHKKIILVMTLLTKIYFPYFYKIVKQILIDNAGYVINGLMSLHLIWIDI